MSIDDEWMQYLIQQHQQENQISIPVVVEPPPPSLSPISDNPAPISDELSISTHTKTLFLNQQIVPYEIFWKIPIIDYGMPVDGVVHKDMKVVMLCEEELQDYQRRLLSISYYKEKILRQINIVHSKRPKYKDERKITIGVCKKDILNSRKKQKGAFMNCFTLIVRFMHDELFREIHVKIFKTGNIEIPGILNAEVLEKTKTMILDILQPHLSAPLDFIEQTDKLRSVLINSNFRCGYYIERDRAYNILKMKYNMDVSYDPCSYPGVKCSFYFNHENNDMETQLGVICDEDLKMTMAELGKNRKYTRVTFTLFRTGSCLISGNCNEKMLYYIYDYVKRFLETEYHNICIQMKVPDVKIKKNKLRKRTIRVSAEYFETLSSSTESLAFSDMTL
jgi:hypothetical protein